MLVMAIEAVRQTESSERKCKGYRFQDVNFTRSLMVPESREGVETQFRLREVESPGNDTTKRYEFSLYVHEHAEWTRCCHGFIQAEYICVDPIDHRNATEEYGACLEACQSPVAHVDFYRHLGSSGLVYGPIFRNMQEINNGRDNRGIGTVDTQPGIIANQETSQSACLIHPAVLDSIIQVAYVGISQGGKKTMPTLVPTKVNELWISASGSWRIKNDSVVQVSTQAIPEGLRSHAVKYVSLRKEDERPFLIGNITFTSIGNAERAAKKRQDPILLYNVAWKPHVNLLTSDAHSVLLSLQHPELPPKASENASLMEYACYVAISNALSTVKNAEANHSNKPAHLQNYLDWMKHQISIMQNGDTIHRFKSLPNEDRKDPERLFKEIESIGAEGRLIAKISQVLPGILLGEVDPLGLLFEDETLAEYYSSENPPAEVSSSVQTYIDSLAHVHPDLRILEIGAGTGGMTCNVLNVLGGSHSETNDKEGGLWRFSEYMFTDISTAFFDAARKKFGREGFVCKTLNIEKDPEKQGFTMESYDVVIASNVSSIDKIVCVKCS